MLFLIKRMVSVSHWVEEIVKHKPFLQEALSKGLINNAALAESLIPEIEKKLKKKIKFSAVNMSVRRLSEKLEKSYVNKLKFDKHSDISIKSNLCVFIIKRTWESQRGVSEIYKMFDNKPGRYFSISQGPSEFQIITNDFYEKDIEEVFPKNCVLKKIKSISALTIKIPENFIDTPGFLYLISRAFALDNINIIDVVSTFTEFTLIISDEDTSRAFEVLRETLNENV